MTVLRFMVLIRVSLTLKCGSSSDARVVQTPSKKFEDVPTKDLDPMNPAHYVVLLKRFKLIVQTTVSSYRVSCCNEWVTENKCSCLEHLHALFLWGRCGGLVGPSPPAGPDGSRDRKAHMASTSASPFPRPVPQTRYTVVKCSILFVTM